MDIYAFGIIALISIQFLIFDWHARFVFVRTGYPRKYGHGKSGGRASAHYKRNWTFIQRILWIPLFREKYRSDYRLMAYFGYFHFFATLVTIACFLIDEFVLVDVSFWFYVFLIHHILSLLRFCHSNAIGKRQI